MKLRISEDLTLPLDAATQTFAFIARKGAGKTYAASKLTEELMEAGVQCAILDTVGNWYGLRLLANGKDQGFDIPVLGGLRGDIPLESTGGELVADLIVETGRSVIIDVSQFSQGDRKKFATALGIRLWQRKKAECNPSPLHLVIEESQLIIPQNVRHDDARMVGIFEEIIRLGRNYGIGVSMITQRPQSVNKEVLTQTECLVVLQVNGTPERKAIKDWIVHQGLDVNLLEELPSLPVGTAYIWSPQWLGILKKVKIAPKKTFDASATPKVGRTEVRRELQPLDLEAFKTKMAATIERAKENDPAELKRTIADLKRKLAQSEQKQPEAKLVSVLTDEDRKALERAYSSASELVTKIETETSHLWESIGNVRTFMSAVEDRLKRVALTSPKISPAVLGRKPTATTAAFSRPAGDSNSNGTLGKCERSILTALAQYPQGRTATQVAILSGYSVNSGGFNNSLGKLRKSEYITRGQPIQITEAGLAALGTYTPLPTGHELANHWIRELPKCEAAILDYLIQFYPGALTSAELAERVGYSADSGGFNNALSRLRTLELINRGQPINASPNFFQ